MLRIKQLREEKGISQKALGQMFNVAQNTISNWENGTREPDTATLTRLAKLFNVSVDYLLGNTLVRTPVETIAAHRDGEGDWTPEELEDIERFKEFVRMKRQSEQNNE